jgi:hypothetical protein
MYTLQIIGVRGQEDFRALGRRHAGCTAQPRVAPLGNEVVGETFSDVAAGLPIGRACNGALCRVSSGSGAYERRRDMLCVRPTTDFFHLAPDAACGE